MGVGQNSKVYLARRVLGEQYHPHHSISSVNFKYPIFMSFPQLNLCNLTEFVNFEHSITSSKLYYYCIDFAPIL